jgi:plasmid maintenance system killer protein
MEIRAKGKLKGVLGSEAACLRQYGRDMTKKIMMRVNELRAAESLGDFWPPMSGPERCHELKGELAGMFSIDLKQPYRLLFVPVEENPPKDRSDERMRWASITKIEIVAIEDTHG